MDNTKLAFIGLAVLAVCFMAVVFMGSGSKAQSAPSDDITAHEIDMNAKATLEPGVQPPVQAGAGNAQAGTGGAGTGQAAGTVQEVSLNAGPSGYDKTEIRVKAGVPVHFTFTANNAGCCAQLLIDKVGVQLISRNGDAVDATFTPPVPGSYPYHCGMNMCKGVLVAE